MAQVLFMQNCFCPDENQLNRLIASLQSLLKMARTAKTENHYRFVLSGYIHDDYIEQVLEIVDEINQTLFFSDAYPELYRANHGKGTVCNRAVNMYANGDDWSHLFLFDNDIVFKEYDVDIAQVLIDQQEEMNAIGTLKYPVISFNFEEHQVHNMELLDKGYKTKYGVVRCSTHAWGCLGGGAWVIEKPHWDEVGGYCVDAIYGKDDGAFYLDTIKMGKMVCMSEEWFVVHPKDDDDRYNQFKADTNINRVRKMNYDELSVDSQNFWNNR